MKWAGGTQRFCGLWGGTQNGRRVVPAAVRRVLVSLWTTSDTPKAAGGGTWWPSPGSCRDPRTACSNTVGMGPIALRTSMALPRAGLPHGGPLAAASAECRHPYAASCGARRVVGAVVGHPRIHSNCWSGLLFSCGRPTIRRSARQSTTSQQAVSSYFPSAAQTSRNRWHTRGTRSVSRTRTRARRRGGERR